VPGTDTIRERAFDAMPGFGLNESGVSGRRLVGDPDKEGLEMERWEYEIDSYPIEQIVEGGKRSETTITCDPNGICIAKDMPSASLEPMIGLLNRRGSMGWELVETHYNSRAVALVTIWKRKKEFQGLEH